jgi:chemotaxis protein histidine kinase CheA
MDQIRRQVAQARRRLVLQQFMGVFPWCLFVALMVAAIALAVPKIWVLPVDQQVWMWSWIGGAAAAGFLIAFIWTYVVRRGTLDAAIEVDRRFGLKERVSSALALQPTERDTEAGRALIHDASQRIEMVVVSEKFSVSAGWRPLLPVMPALVAFALAFLIPNAQSEQAKAAAAATQQKQLVKASTQELKKKLAQKKEDAQKKGLQDAEDLFRKITLGIDELNNKDDVDQKKALVKLNDLAKELAQKRDSLGDSEKMKQQFDKLKELQKGPADKMAEALKEGNFEKAIEELKQLKEQLEKGELKEADKEKLAQQLEQMKQKLQEMAEAHKEAKRELERQIEQKMKEGDLEAVNKLQKKLDELKKADKQMTRMESMASKCEQCQAAMKEGDAQKAAAELAKLEQDLDSMQADLEQLETINEIMDELADAKDAMRGEQDGNMMGKGMMDEPLDQIGFGDGMNEGKGGGYRDEQETATGTYDSRQRAQPKAGAAVRVGDAGGPNRANKSTEDIKEQIISSLSKDSDPLTDQRLPRSQQDHVKEYYQRLRKGE